MSETVLMFLPIYLPILLGYLAQVTGYFPVDYAHPIRQFCLKVAIPLMVFTNMATLDTSLLAQVLPVTLTLPLWMGFLWLAALGVSRLPVFSQRRLEVVLVIMLSNIGYIGWAVSDIGLGPEGLARSIMFATLLWPSTIAYAFLSQLIVRRSEGGLSSALRTMRIAVPVLTAFIFGLFVSLFDITMPGAVMTPLTAFGRMASPLILFGVGLSISFKARWRELSFILPLKLVLGFTAAWLAVLVVDGLDELSRRVVLIVSLMPVGANSLIVGDMLDLDEGYIAGAVTLSTLLALITIPLTLLFLG